MADIAPKRSSSEPPLLYERMTSLGLSPALVEQSSPAVMQRLEHACGSCSLKAQCRKDMTSDQHAPDIAAYCPNEQSLQALRKI